MRWEFLKYKCKKISRNYSIQKSKERKHRRIFLEKKVTELESQILSSSSDHMIHKYNQYKSELEKLYGYVTAVIILRSRITWYEQGEKSSKYFMNLEKRCRAKSHIRKLMTESDIQTDPSSIMSSAKSFNSTLYKRRSSKSEKDCLEYLKNINIPKLTENERFSCKGILTKKDCWDALQSTKNNKSLGNDGLTKKFYVCFFKKISSELVDTLNHSFKTGKLSASQRQALITSIKKKMKIRGILRIGDQYP